MEHSNRVSEPKLLHRCALPRTGEACVDMVITDLAVFTIDKLGGSGLTLIELAPEVTFDEVHARTQAHFVSGLERAR